MGLAILSGSLPFNVLDNVQFAIFVESLSGNRYKLPSRTYMTTTVVSAMYKATREVITEMLKNIQHIAFTTDAWRSFHKDSYITITAHVLDDDLTLHSFVLDTSEIKDRHTGVHNVIHTGTEHTNTFIRDNASDISKALREQVEFQWFGCAGHNMKLTVRSAFNKNRPTARLLTKCKNIVKAVNHRQPILYDVQVMTTRWCSILHMLPSILNNSHLLLTEDEKAKIKELIALLKPFKILEK